MELRGEPVLKGVECGVGLKGIEAGRILLVLESHSEILI